MSIEIPVRARDFDEAWMEAALAEQLNGVRIKAVHAQRLSEPGRTSEAIDITVSFDGGTCPLPTRYIAKLGSNDPDVLAMIAVFGQYRREVALYDTFPDIGIPKPKCYFSRCSDDGSRMVLLLEHLAPARCPSWGPTLPEIETALGHLPAFHAKWWNVPGIKQQSCLIPTRSNVLVDGFAAAAAAADKVMRTFGNAAQIAVSCLTAISAKIERWQDYMDSRPVTIVHADYHGKQMFMPSAEGGTFSVIDWQFPYAAEGAWDFARLLATCLSTEDWRQHGERLVAEYHSGLKQNGVTDYSQEELLDGLRMGVVVSSMINSIATASTNMELVAKECEGIGLDWKDVWFLRHTNMMEDLGVEAFVRNILE